MEVKNKLVELGFSVKEIEVYLALLRIGKSTPAHISKLTKLNRPTVYSVAKTLISKGVILEDAADKQLFLTPLPPEHLLHTIEKSKAELKKREQLIGEIVGDLKLVTAEKNYSVPKIRFIEQGEMNDFLYHNLSKWHKTLKEPDTYVYGFQDHSFVENYQEWVKWADEKYQGSKFKVRLFSNDSKIEKEMKDPASIRSIRFLEGSQFTSTNWIIGEYIIMIYTRNAPFYAVEIHDVAMAKNMNEVFKIMWKTVR